jgi:hypothetical protein
MTLATKVAALLAMVRRQDLEELPPAERQRLAALCRHVAEFAEPPPPRSSGVLYDLKTGRRPE